MMIDDAVLDANEFQDALRQLGTLAAQIKDSTLVIYKPSDQDRQLLSRVLATYYLSANQRSKIMDAFRGCYGLLNLLMGYVYQASEQIAATGERFWLQTGCVAAHIERSLGKVDYRDELLALAELYVTAEEAGLDPQAEFEEIIGLKDFSSYAVVTSRRRR